jgi:hypothetical protein
VALDACASPLLRRSVSQLRWSTFGPHAIGAERFATVSSGASFAQMEGAILGKQARLENPGKWLMACGHP